MDTAEKTSLAAVSIQARSLDIPTGSHPNKMPFSGVMTRIDEPSDTAPHGSDGKRVMITMQAAEQALNSLLGMAVDYRPDFADHDPQAKIGVITAATIEGNAICIEGFIYAADFPEVAREIKANKDSLGFSFEARDLMTTNPKADPIPIVECVFTGAAILLKEKAAYTSTSINAATAANEDIFTMDDNAKKEIAEIVAAALAPVAEAVAAQGEALKKFETEKVEAANHIAKVERHAVELEKAAEHMDAAGVGGDPDRGHAKIARDMAADLRANAVQGRIPAAFYSFHAAADKGTDEVALAAKVKAAAEKVASESNAKIDEMKAAAEKAEKAHTDEVASLKTKIADLEAAALKPAAPTTAERKTLSPSDMKLLSKTGIEPDAAGKLNTAKLDTVLASMIPSPEKRIQFKTALASVGMIA